MKMAKEDLQYIRQLIAERHGKEMTPEEVLETMREVKEVEIVEDMGLVSELRRLRREDK